MRWPMQKRNDECDNQKHNCTVVYVDIITNRSHSKNMAPTQNKDWYNPQRYWSGQIVTTSLSYEYVDFVWE